MADAASRLKGLLEQLVAPEGPEKPEDSEESRHHSL